MTPEQALGIVLAHLVGDYIIQSHWMANRKTESWPIALLHGVTYTIPYALVTQSPLALAVIAGTHALIDRYRLARWVVWASNQLAPKAWRNPVTATGYSVDTPAWLAVWLLFITDNTIHLLINVAAVVWVA